MKFRKMLIAILAASLSVAACGGSAPPAAPPAAPTAPVAAKPAEPAKKPTSAKKSDESPKAEGEKKGIPAAQKAEVPKDWATMYDEAKGYEFEIPADSETYDETIDGVDVFAANLPGGKVQVLVVAFKDKTLSREDLLDGAERFLTGIGCKEIKIDNLTDITDDYGLADAAFIDSEGKKGKARVLVATDVTDNYIMIVGSDEADYKANEHIIDAIWGSFAMWSGGASGDS